MANAALWLLVIETEAREGLALRAPAYLVMCRRWGSNGSPLRRVRNNCEHALVELGGIETQKSVRDVRLDR